MEAASTEFSVGQQRSQSTDDFFGPGISRRLETDANEVRIELKNPWRNVGKKNVVVNQLHIKTSFFKNGTDCQYAKRWNQIVSLTDLRVYE